MREVLEPITVQTLSYDTYSCYTLGNNDFDILFQNEHSKHEMDAKWNSKTHS
jgi:hypothetical protein